MSPNKIYLRRNVKHEDVETVRNITTSTGFFTPEEIEIAVELVNENLEKGPASGYNFLFVENNQGETLGYACYGKIPGTKSSFALYWIAVYDKHQNQGAGGILLGEVENDIFSHGGTGIYVETSSREQYDSTRVFYASNGYLQKARFEDYYEKGDDLVFYVKKSH